MKLFIVALLCVSSVFAANVWITEEGVPSMLDYHPYYEYTYGVPNITYTVNVTFEACSLQACSQANAGSVCAPAMLPDYARTTDYEYTNCQNVTLPLQRTKSATKEEHYQWAKDNFYARYLEVAKMAQEAIAAGNYTITKSACDYEGKCTETPIKCIDHVCYDYGYSEPLAKNDSQSERYYIFNPFLHEIRKGVGLEAAE